MSNQLLAVFRRPGLRASLATLFGVLCFALPAARAEPTKHALLAACTEYPVHPGIKPLKGPKNDLRLWSSLLTGAFGFPKELIVELAGSPEDAASPPTRVNIIKAFQNLIDKAGPGDQVFITLNGHGSQIPIPSEQKDPLDPANPEPDGLDEIFLPADVKRGPNGELVNFIRDDEIGRWLDQLRAKGAHVWIVFDCCHSGTMTRAVGVEQDRNVPMTDLGLSRDEVEKAVERARQAVARAKLTPQQRGELEKGVAALGGKGSLVAVYAAQAFETAPDLPRPDGTAPVAENYHGMLSYTLAKALEQLKGVEGTNSRLIYRELMQHVATQYLQERGNRGPTPFIEGDVTREVFGLQTWPGRSEIVLEKRPKDELRVTAGSLRGLSPGAILAVHSRAGDSPKPDSVLGYVRVESVTPVQAQVKPCASPDGQTPAVAAEQFPNLARCEPVLLDLGDLRIKLFVDPKLAPALTQVSGSVLALVDVVVDESKARWSLKGLAPEKAKAAYGVDLKVDQVLLVWANQPGVQAELKPDLTGFLKESRPAGPKQVVTIYPIAEKDLATHLECDLPKLFRWQNVWRCSQGAGGGPASAKARGVQLEVKIRNKPLTDTVLTVGQEIEYHIANSSNQDYWVNLVMISPDFSVLTRSLGVVKARQPLELAERVILETEDGVEGLDGVLVFAVPTSDAAGEPRFDFLDQEPIRKTETKKGASDQAPNTPFGKLMAAAAFGGPQMKGQRVVSSTDPIVLSRSWTTLTKPKTDEVP